MRSLTAFAMVAALLVGAVASFRPACAQESRGTPLQVREEIRFDTDSSVRFEGCYFVGVTATDSLILNFSKRRWRDTSETTQDDMTIALADIHQIEARRCCGSTFAGIKAGASYGGVVGVALGLIGVGVGCATKHLNCSAQGFGVDAVLFTLGRAAIGAVVGSIYGAIRPPKEWRPVPMPTGPTATPWRRQ